MTVAHLPLRLLASGLSPGGPRAHLMVLIYHRVLAEPDPYRRGDVTVSVFDWQMALLAREFNVLSLDQAVRRLAAGTLPARAVCVSFDDGYRDNLDLALPVLQRHGLPATFFIATDYLDGGAMWNDCLIEAIARAGEGSLDLSDLGLERYALHGVADRYATVGRLLPALKHLENAQRRDVVAAVMERCKLQRAPDLMLSPEGVRALHAAGMAIGAHTCSHPILTRLDPASARREMADGRDRLEAMIDAPVRLFAYPNGKPGEDYDAHHVAMARELGFAAAVCTAWGNASAGADLFQLPRFTPWDRVPLRFHLRLVGNLLRRETLPALAPG